MPALALESSSESQKIFAPAFKLTYTVELTASNLKLSLKVDSSKDSEPLEFQTAFHTYFRLPQGVKPPQVCVTGLEGLEIFDKVGPNAPETKREDRKKAYVDGPDGDVDRVYFGVPSKLEIEYNDAKHEKMTMTSENYPDAVLLNPGPKKGATIADIHEGGWDEYICLEAVRLRDWAKVAPGESWTGQMTLTPTSA